MSANDLLARAQSDFAAALRSAGGETQAASWLAGEASRNHALLALYRGNVFANHAAALALAYPVLRQVVGEEYFGGLARACLRAHPSRSGNLDEAGAVFTDFLARFAPAQELPYLSDLARIEWAVACAWRAADAVPAGADWLGAIATAAVATQRIPLHPSAQVLESAWPIASLWQQHQPSHEGGIDIDLSCAERALVWRSETGVEVASLTPAEHGFWHALRGDAPLAQALDAAFSRSADFDVARTLRFALAHALIARAPSTDSPSVTGARS